jgi:hypothetical protein
MRESSSGRYLISAALVIGLIFVALENLSIHQFQQCVAAKTADNSTKESDQESRVIIVLRDFGAQSICTVRVLDKHNGFFAALGGLAVAFFTFTLWQSTEKMWRASIRQSEDLGKSIAAAEKSADATAVIAASDRAWITQKGLTFADIQDTSFSDVYYKKTLGLYVQWQNRGQSPAIKAVAYSANQIRDIKSRDIPTFEADFRNAEISSPVGPGADFSAAISLLSEEDAALFFDKNLRSIFIPRSNITTCLTPDYCEKARSARGSRSPALGRCPTGKLNRIGRLKAWALKTQLAKKTDTALPPTVSSMAFER